MKIILDTNVIVSGLFWQGISGKIVKDVFKEEFTICFSEDTLDELKKVLIYSKFRLKIQNLNFTIEDFLIELTKNAIIVSTPIKINLIKSDPDDNKFLACALSAQANFIVSGDQHLLKLKTFQSIPILTPRKFLEKLK